MKQWFSRHWTTSKESQGSLRAGKQMRGAYNYPSLWQREFLGSSTGRGDPLGALPELRRWSWEFGEAKVTRFHRAEYQRGESCTERKFQRSIEQSTKY